MRIAPFVPVALWIVMALCTGCGFFGDDAPSLDRIESAAPHSAPLTVAAVGTGEASLAQADAKEQQQPAQPTSEPQQPQPETKQPDVQPATQPAQSVPAETPKTASAPAPQEPPQQREEAKNPLIRGLRELLDSVGDDADFDADRDALDEELMKADKIITDSKARNREAIRQANRQVRVRGPQSPNIVLILADDLGYGELSCYGQTRFKTPHVDQLAADGTRFTNFYAGSPHDAASRWSLMTGADALHAARKDNLPAILKISDATLAEVLWQAGYTTGFVGKWGIPTDDAAPYPHQHGFEEWYGPLGANENSEPFPATMRRNGVETPVSENADAKKGKALHQLVTDEALAFIDRHNVDQRPFCLVVSYELAGIEADQPADESQKDWTPAQRNRAAAVALIDRHVGELVERLVAMRIDDNTAIFFVSDNGPAADDAVIEFLDGNGPLRGKKGDLSEGGLRVPMIVRWPIQMDVDATAAHVCSVADVAPTLYDLVGAWRTPENLDGYSFIPAVYGEEQKDHAFIGWDYGPTQPVSLPNAARMGQWKLLRGKDAAGYEVYDLTADPGESQNLAESKKDVLERFQALFPAK